MVRIELAMQTFKARLSKTIDAGAFREKWKERSGGFPVEFRIDGAELTAVNSGTRWDKSKEPGSGGFCNVLQMAVHDVARDCTVIDCEEVSQVNF
ncbi:MAG: hypothetical protein WB711_16630 [Terriglobales bacterium]|jgi:hypothetical protein